MIFWALIKMWFVPSGFQCFQSHKLELLVHFEAQPHTSGWWGNDGVSTAYFSAYLHFWCFFIAACKHKAKQDNLAADEIWWEHFSQHWQALFYLQSDSNGMLWPGCGQAQLCPKVLTVADELIHVNLSALHTSSSAQLWNGWILQLPSCKVWKIPD